MNIFNAIVFFIAGLTGVWFSALAAEERTARVLEHHWFLTREIYRFGCVLVIGGAMLAGASVRTHLFSARTNHVGMWVFFLYFLAVGVCTPWRVKDPWNLQFTQTFHMARGVALFFASLFAGILLEASHV
jgi:hypothetical protein